LHDESGRAGRAHRLRVHVEKLGREVRRGQTENTRQGYRNGGRAPYGYRLKHEPHPDPARARAGAGQLRVKALVSSAFNGVRDLKSLVANGWNLRGMLPHSLPHEAYADEAARRRHRRGLSPRPS
jgi:hypothetical protein